MYEQIMPVENTKTFVTWCTLLGSACVNVLCTIQLECFYTHVFSSVGGENPSLGVVEKTHVTPLNFFFFFRPLAPLSRTVDLPSSWLPPSPPSILSPPPLYVRSCISQLKLCRSVGGDFYLSIFLTFFHDLLGPFL